LGEEFGGCKVVELLGHGSLGSVYRAEHTAECAVIAIKILPPFLAKRFPHFITRYMAQSRRVADLNHPNVLQVYQVGEHRGFVFTTMKFVEGKSLSECIGEKKTVKSESAVKVARSAAFGLRAMSDSGVLHRNLKPGNILLGRDSKVLVSDFGLGPGSSAELKGSVFGTGIMNPRYLSPEQAANDSIDCRSDIYSLGAILYRMVTGYTPFDELENGRRAYLTPPIERNPKVPEDVSKVICRMMEYSPEDRYPTWNEVIDDLDSLFNGTLSELPTQISEVPAPAETADIGADNTDTERHEAVQQILSMLPDATPVESLTDEKSTDPPAEGSPAQQQEPARTGFVEDNAPQEMTQPQTSPPPAVLPTEEETLPPTRSPFYNPDNVETVKAQEEALTLQDADRAKTLKAAELLARMEQSVSHTDTDATVDYGTVRPATEGEGQGQLSIDPTFDIELTQQLTNLQKGPQSPGTVDEIDRTVTYVSDAEDVGLPAPPPPQSLAPPPTQQALEPLPDEEKPQIQFPFGGNYETPPAEFPSPQSKLELDAPSQHLTPAAPLTTLQGDLPVQTVQTVQTVRQARPTARRRSVIYERKRSSRERETVALITAVVTSAIFVIGAAIFWSMRTSEPTRAAPPPIRRTVPKSRPKTVRQKPKPKPVDRSAAIKRSVTDRVNQNIATHKWGEAIRSLENFARTQTTRSMENWAVQMAQRVRARAQDEFSEITRRAETAIKVGDQDEARDLYRIVFLNYDLEPYVSQARNKYAALLEAGTETEKPKPEVTTPQPAEKLPAEPVLDTPNFVILDSLVAQWRFADAVKQCTEYLDASRYETSPELLSIQKTIDLLPGLKHAIIEHLNRTQKKPKIDSLTEPPSAGKIFRATDRSLTVQSGVKVTTLPWDRLHASGMWRLAMDAVSPSNYKMRLAAVLLAVEMDSPAVAAKEVERLKSIGVDVTLYHQRIEHRRSERLKRLGVE
jgi:serine/threonine protein kinase